MQNLGTDTEGVTPGGLQEQCWPWPPGERQDMYSSSPGPDDPSRAAVRQGGIPGRGLTPGSCTVSGRCSAGSLADGPYLRSG